VKSLLSLRLPPSDIQPATQPAGALFGCGRYLNPLLRGLPLAWKGKPGSGTPHSDLAQPRMPKVPYGVFTWYEPLTCWPVVKRNEPRAASTATLAADLLGS
jgi:hypothetical protein